MRCFLRGNYNIRVVGWVERTQKGVWVAQLPRLGKDQVVKAWRVKSLGWRFVIFFLGWPILIEISFLPMRSDRMISLWVLVNCRKSLVVTSVMVRDLVGTT